MPPWIEVRNYNCQQFCTLCQAAASEEHKNSIRHLRRVQQWEGARSSPIQPIPVASSAAPRSRPIWVQICRFMFTGSVSGSSQPKPSPVGSNVFLDPEDVEYAEEEHNSTDRASGFGHIFPLVLLFIVSYLEQLVFLLFFCLCAVLHREKRQITLSGIER